MPDFAGMTTLIAIPLECSDRIYPKQWSLSPHEF